MKTPLISLLTAFLITACETHHYTVRHVDNTEDRPGLVLLLSHPPGASIQVNGKTVGLAPCTAMLPVLFANGKWILTQSTTIAAHPEQKGQVSQSKFFREWTEAPKEVGFEMHGEDSPPLREVLGL